MITPNESYPKLAKALGVSEIYFKREDLHPYGSHKGRSIPVMIDHYYAKGSRNFAISSSGNAALAAALHTIELNKNKVASSGRNSGSIQNDLISLDIFVGQNIAPHKLNRIKEAIKINTTGDTSPQIRILTKERPLQALTQAVQEGATSLRQSTDDEALIGYEELAREISEVRNVGAIFIGTSSGTTAQALANFFLKQTNMKSAGTYGGTTNTRTSPVQIHIIQTSACHPLSDAFTACESEEEISLADAIVDKTALRKSTLIGLIKNTGGAGWCATNEDIEGALKLVKDNTGLDISPNSALSIVGVMKTAYTSHPIGGTIVCIICGE